MSSTKEGNPPIVIKVRNEAIKVSNEPLAYKLETISTNNS